jgi:hypothetical protein
MSIRVTCGQGGHKLNVPDNLAGRKVRCPMCQAIIAVPPAATPSLDPDDVPPAAEQTTLAPSTAAQRGAKPARPRAPARKRGGGGWKWLLVLGGGLMVVLVAAGLGYFVFMPKKTGPSPARDREAVRETARRFIDATKSDDPSWRNLLTDKARENMSKDRGFKPTGPAKLRPGMTAQVGEANIMGDTAQVTVTVREAGQQQQFVLNLRRQGGDWRIRGMEIEVVAGQPGLPMDFEDPGKMMAMLFGKPPGDLAKDMTETMNKGLEDSLKGKPTAEDLAIEALKPFDRAAFDATWKGDLAVAGKPAATVLRELARAFDFELATTPEQEKALAGAITVKLDGASRYERLDAISRQAGFYPVHADPFARLGSKASVSLKQLPRTYPAAFAGPFLVEVVEVREYVPHASGELELRVVGSGLPPTVSRALDRDTSPLVVTQVVDAMGRDLHDRSRRDMGGKMWKMVEGGWDRPFSVPLKNLLRDVTAIKTLRGKLRVPLPSRVENLRFEPPRAGAVLKAGAVEVKLTRFNQTQMNFNGKKYPQQSFSLSVKGAGPDQLKVIAYDAGKKLRGVSRQGYGGSDREGHAEFTIQGEPVAALVVKIVANEPAEYEFHLDDMPLASAAQMPEKLAPATFAGHDAPMSVEFVRTMKDGFLTKAQLRITNHADKAIRSLNLKLDYHDAAGKRVGGWNNVEHSAQAKPQQKDLPLVVAKNATATVEVQAPFLPAGASTIKAVATRVTFADATEWSAGK